MKIDLVETLLQKTVRNKSDYLQHVVLEQACNETTSQTVRNFIKDILTIPGKNVVSVQCKAELLVACHEITTNIIQHSYKDDECKSLRIEAFINSRHVIIAFFHKGVYFKPVLKERPKYDGSKDRGFGLHIINLVADIVEYGKLNEDENYVMIQKSSGGLSIDEKPEEITTVDLEIKFRNNVTIIIFPSESLDANNSRDIKAAIDPAIERNKFVVFNLERLQFIDSSGLGLILSGFKRIKSNGGDLKMTGMTNQVKVLFELVKLDKIFETYPTTEEAISSFSKW